jgi:hypothetical protein
MVEGICGDPAGTRAISSESRVNSVFLAEVKGR